MLAALVGLQIAAGLLLRGAWDVWAQSAVQLLLCAGLGVWLAARAVHGRVPKPAEGALAWAAALALLSFASARLSPVSAYSLPAWSAAAAGLWLFPAATLLSPPERARVEQFARAAAWALVLVAVHQKLNGHARPPSLLINQNVFAGAALLLLPVAARRGDGALVAALLLCLWWTKSVGAWLGLSAALLLHRRLVGPAAFWAGAAAGFAGLVAAYAKLQSPEVLHRLAWWQAAWSMALDSPWEGLGPGSFAYALPSYVDARPELSSLFAHQHYLETAAERGWLYLALWLAGLAVLLRRARPGERFGPTAALAHGLVDYALAVSGVFWLFCLSASWALPSEEEALAVRAEQKLPAAALALLAGAAAFAWVSGNWRADRLRAGAAASLSAGEPRAAAERRLAGSEYVRPHPEAARLRAELALERGAAAEAAGHLERAVSMDPYRCSSWSLLEGAYLRQGRTEEAARARERGARACPARGGP